jgi:hypothetical protein
MIQSAHQATLRDLELAPPEVLAQYDLSKMDAVDKMIDKLKDVRPVCPTDCRRSP